MAAPPHCFAAQLPLLPLRGPSSAWLTDFPPPVLAKCAVAPPPKAVAETGRAVYVAILMAL